MMLCVSKLPVGDLIVFIMLKIVSQQFFFFGYNHLVYMCKILCMTLVMDSFIKKYIKKTIKG